MARKTRDSEDGEGTKWFPTTEDTKQLASLLKEYPQERVNGQLQRPYDLYCKSIGVIRFDEKGNRSILQVGDYHRLTKINDKLEAGDYWERDAYMASHPEERQKLLDNIKEMGKKFRTNDDTNQS